MVVPLVLCSLAIPSQMSNLLVWLNGTRLNILLVTFSASGFLTPPCWRLMDVLLLLPHGHVLSRTSRRRELMLKLRCVKHSWLQSVLLARNCMSSSLISQWRRKNSPESVFKSLMRISVPLSSALFHDTLLPLLPLNSLLLPSWILPSLYPPMPS